MEDSDRVRHAEIGILLDSEIRTHLWLLTLLPWRLAYGRRGMHLGSCPQQQVLPTGWTRSNRRAIPTFLSIVLALVLAPLIACISPADPFWIAGIHDGADGDDIVTLVDNITGVGAESTPALPGLHCSFHRVLTSKSDIKVGFTSRPFSRGPPRPSGL